MQPSIARELLGRDASAQTLEAIATGLEGKEPTRRAVVASSGARFAGFPEEVKRLC